MSHPYQRASVFGQMCREAGLADIRPPRRIQRSRARGWRLPTGAVIVDRSSAKWGNPFKVGEPVARESSLFPYAARAVAGFDSSRVAGFSSIRLLTVEQAVEAYGWWFIEQPALMLTVREELGGRVLACWCPPSPPGEIRCHADWLVDFLAEETT